MAGEHRQITPLAKAAAELELPKVLELVARYALTPMAAADIKNTTIAVNPQQIDARLQTVAAYRRLLDDGESLPVETFSELETIFSQLKLAGSVLLPQNLAALAVMTRIARNVQKQCSEHKETYPLLWQQCSHIVPQRGFEKSIEQAIDFASHEILDSASPALRRIRREIDSVQQKARTHLQHILKKASEKSMLQEQLITMRDGRLVLMVKDEFRSKINGVVHDQSASGQTLFIEPVQTVEYNNRVRQLQAEERHEIDRILAELSEQAREVRQPMLINYHALVALDALQAKAHFARDFDCNPPSVNDRGGLVLYAARHPLLLEKFRNSENGQRVVPLQIELGKRFNVLIITGPNAGGKTVAMKTVGLLVLMARMGLHIPASADSEIGIMGNLFVDIGDQQSIENDLSTFSSHTANLRQMVELAQQNDLILIDEMGSGTDPDEGSALAVAVLSHFLQKNVRCIATTHHGALKAFAHETAGVENGSMIFDNDTLQPTYRFRPGVPGSSYAFDIAARMGLSKSIIAAARQLVGSEKGKVEHLIADLGDKIQQQEKLIQDLKLEETRLTGLAKLYKDRADELAENERKLKKQAIEQSEAIIAQANATIEQTIRSIREQQASREAIREAKQQIEAQKQNLAQERKKLERKPKVPKSAAGKTVEANDIQPGMSLRWSKQNSQVTVLERPDDSGRVHIQVGSLRLRVPVTELQTSEAPARQNIGRISIVKPENISQQIDLRGMRAEDAIAAVDSYLSDALLYGWERVRILHGKGTGALRKAITDHLRSHPNVAAFDIAAMGQGDYGVTEVELK